MKTLVEINSLNYASTGNITLNIAKTAREKGYKVYTCCRNSLKSKKRSYEDQIIIGFWLDRVISERLSYLTGLNGYFNVLNTYLFINKLKKIKPNIIHIHSLCDNYLNIKMFFNYLKKSNTPVVWTLHDNWAFTGRCSKSICDKWKVGCGDCPCLKVYPESLFMDNSRYVLNERSKIYNSLNNLTLVTPSKYMANLVKQSLFKDNHDVHIINNGINLNVFKPTVSDFREKNNLQDKIILLGVAYGWSKDKGLDSFIYLSEQLPKNYQIILVGVDNDTDMPIPDSIMCIRKTYNQEELVKIYSSCDLFVNPTIDDNFPTVNIEALACGLPVLTFATGGSAEIIDEKSGDYVISGDKENLLKRVIEITSNHPYSKEDCVSRAHSFEAKKTFNKYIGLFEDLLNKNQQSN